MRERVRRTRSWRDERRSVVGTGPDESSQGPALPIGEQPGRAQSRASALRGDESDRSPACDLDQLEHVTGAQRDLVALCRGEVGREPVELELGPLT